jgi:hypothetical protein
MQSAFGIDHGEVSKVRVPPHLRVPGTKNSRRATAAQRRTAGLGGPSGPQKVKGALNRVGEADISLKGIGEGAGRSLRGVGGFLEKRPGLTGTALVGGGGAAGYKYLSGMEPKKKRR